MPKVIALVIAMVSLIPPNATAQPISKVLSTSGALGTWARDCSQPAEINNPRLIFAAPLLGHGSLYYDMGPGNEPVEFEVLRVSDLSIDRVLIHEYRPENNFLADLILRVANGKIRVLWQRESDTGKVLIRDGVIDATGGGTDWLEHCG